jgi:hypothetical protein
MRPRRVVLGAAALLLTAGVAYGHITPPVVLLSDRAALALALAGARRFFVREVRLSSAEKEAVAQRTRWTPDEDFYRFYLGRDADGRLVAAAVFVSDYTIHGPVRVAVAIGADRAVRAVRVVEVTEETYGWVKPLIDGDFPTQFVGRPATQPGTLPAVPDPMSEFYAKVIAGLVARGAALLEVAGVGDRSP